MSRILESALAYQKAGLSILPVGTNKIPMLSTWSHLQKEIASPEQVQKWFSNKQAMIALIGGMISGNTEIEDFDGQGEQFKAWSEIIKTENPGLYGRLVIEQSPSGGFHVIYRCTEMKIPGNQKLSQKGIKVPGPGEHEYREKTLKAGKYGDEWFIVPDLIETRGEAGYCLVAPSKNYTPIQGSLVNIPVITAAERALLIDTARSLNEWIAPNDFYRPPTKQYSSPGQKSPGDDFDERGDITEIVSRHGWTKTGRTGAVNGSPAEYWRRPGKNQGHSATLIDGKIFFVFSSNAYPFEPNKAYGPFGAYAILEHNGDFTRAAQELSRQGYGTRGPQVSGLSFAQLSKRFSSVPEWIYRRHLPKAQPVLFNGREGDGKSTICLQMSKEILEIHFKGVIIWIASEGAVRNTFNQMVDVGLRDERFQIAHKADGSFLFDFGQPADLRAFESFLSSFNVPILAVYLDSLRGITQLPENEGQIGKLMHRINSLVCDKFGATLVYLHHLNKSGQGSLLNQSSGNTAITAAVRHVLTVTRRSKFVRVIRCAKSNIDDTIPELEVVKIGRDITIQPALKCSEESLCDRAEKFVTELFVDRTEIEAAEVYRAGEKLGFSSSLLKKVKGNLGIDSRQQSPGKPWFWTWSLRDRVSGDSGVPGECNSLNSCSSARDTDESHDCQSHESHESHESHSKNNHDSGNNSNNNQCLKGYDSKHIEIEIDEVIDADI